MTIKEITYTQTIQVRNFEPVSITAVAAINQGEDYEEVAAKLRAFVQGQLKKIWQDAHDKIKSNAESIKEVVKEPVAGNKTSEKSEVKTIEVKPGTYTKNKKPVAVQQTVTATPKQENNTTEPAKAEGEVPNF